DESGAVLAYLARGLHAEVALLSLTRGEGGQNDLGPEQAPQLGLIRTQELLAATRGYGARLCFTRAKDFGFSKTPEETEKVWGDRKPVEVLDVDRGEKPQGYCLPLDDTSPLYGKTWREIGLDAFANHRSQGIAVFLGSAFLRRPIALKREDGQPLNPAMLAEPL